MKPPFKAYTGEDPYVFVCYSHEDKSVVYAELEWLGSQNINIWYDEGIAPGVEWPERIASAIQNSERVLFYLSPHAARSRVCRDEVNLAIAEGKSIVVVQLEPTNLTGGLKLSLGTSQAIIKDRYRSVDDYRDDLKATLLDSGILRTTHTPRRKTLLAIYGSVLTLLIALILTLYFQTTYNEGQKDPVADTIMPSVDSQDSIAVLPFRDMSPDGNLEYLGEGLAEELIHGLTQVPALRVVARTSSFFFKNQDIDVQIIGERLGATRVLEGSVQRNDDQLKVTLQLVDVETGFHVWSKQYDGYLVDIFGLQDEIAQNVVNAMMPAEQISNYGDLSDVGTVNSAAYNAFLIGKYERTQQSRESIDRAIEQFKRSIDLDPGFIRAYIELIEAYDFRGFYYGDRDVMMALAAEVLEQARAYDPEESNPDWYWVEQLVLNQTRLPLNFEEAEQQFREMIINKSHPANGADPNTGLYRYSLLLAKSGLFNSAIAFMQSLEVIDPLHIDIKLRLAEFYAAIHDYDRALTKYGELLELSPGYVQAFLDMFLINGTLGRLEQAQEIQSRLAAVFPLELTQLMQAYMVFWNGQTNEAIAALDALAASPNIPANYKGVSYLAFGETEKAFIYFNIAADQNDPYVSELAMTQARVLSQEQWDDLQNTELFKSFMNRFGYDDAWTLEIAEKARTIVEYTGIDLTLLEN